MRADRLLRLALLLQARGRMTAAALAAELEVSVRTVYRDIAALDTAGVPVITESGPNGGCYLVDRYRFPLRGLSADEAEALLLLGVPPVLAGLGLVPAVSASPPLVHLDMPGWFRTGDPVAELPCLRTAAEALQQGRRLEIGYNGRPRPVLPLGLVNKAGTWYLVATAEGRDEPAVYRVGRMTAARLLPERVARPAGHDLVAFWERWSASFEASRPRIPVVVRASPVALAAFPELFGDGVRAVLDVAGPPDSEGWREVTLTFEHEAAAGHKLAGFGGEVEVLSPPSIRDWLLAAARETLALYQQGGSGSLP